MDRSRQRKLEARERRQQSQNARSHEPIAEEPKPIVVATIDTNANEPESIPAARNEEKEKAKVEAVAVNVERGAAAPQKPIKHLQGYPVKKGSTDKGKRK